MAGPGSIGIVAAWPLVRLVGDDDAAVGVPPSCLTARPLSSVVGIAANVDDRST